MYDKEKKYTFYHGLQTEFERQHKLSAAPEDSDGSLKYNA